MDKIGLWFFIVLFLHDGSSFSILDFVKPKLSHIFGGGRQENGKRKDKNLFSAVVAEPLINNHNDNSVIDSLFQLNAKDIVNAKETKTKTSKFDDKNKIVSKVDDNVDVFHKNVNGSASNFLDFENEKDLQLLLESENINAWNQLESTILNYIGLYKTGDVKFDNIIPVSYLYKIIEIGDKINLLSALGKRLEPEMVQHFVTLFKYFIGWNDWTPSSNTIDNANTIFNDIAWAGLEALVKSTLKESENATSRKELLTYAKGLESINPLASKGLLFLLNLPMTGGEEGSEGRSFGYSGRYSRLPYSRLSRRQGYDYDYNLRYNGNAQAERRQFGLGGGGVGGGIALDPYLILAAIGTSALLAFVAYRILRTPKASGRKLDDNPGEIWMVHNALETSKRIYEDNLMSFSEDLVEGSNNLWRNAIIPSGCIRCSLFSSISTLPIEILSSIGLILSSVAHLLGGEHSGQLLDEVANSIANDADDKVSCNRKDGTCLTSQQ